MISTSCLLCGPSAPSSQIFAQRFDKRQLAGGDFGARKSHARLHYRIVRCDSCGLIRSDPILDPAKIAHLYEESDFSYGDVAEKLASTYLEYARPIFAHLSKDSRILDIGCGNGFFLNALYDRGYTHLLGYEPSIHAIQCADDRIRPLISNKMFTPHEAEAHHARYDLICFFHVLDHIAEPDQFLETCHKMLKPGGFVYGVAHDAESLIHRIFGEQSVMYDIQHIYLFSRSTINRLLNKLNYSDIASIRVANTFPLWYLVHMSPIPTSISTCINACTPRSFSLKLPVGNMAFWARKNM